MSLSAKRDIHLTGQFQKDLKRLPEAVKRSGWEIAQLLAEDVFHPTLDIKKLHGYSNVWRTKVKHVYRMVYTAESSDTAYWNQKALEHPQRGAN